MAQGVIGDIEQMHMTLLAAWIYICVLILFTKGIAYIF